WDFTSKGDNSIAFSFWSGVVVWASAAVALSASDHAIRPANRRCDTVMGSRGWVTAPAAAGSGVNDYYLLGPRGRSRLMLMSLNYPGPDEQRRDDEDDCRAGRRDAGHGLDVPREQPAHPRGNAHAHPCRRGQTRLPAEPVCLRADAHPPPGERP